MNHDGKVALEYLHNLSMGAVSYEPDGNCPLDLTIGANIAVEVRRLNKHPNEPNPESLEQADVPL